VGQSNAQVLSELSKPRVELTESVTWQVPGPANCTGTRLDIEESAPAGIVGNKSSALAVAISSEVGFPAVPRFGAEHSGVMERVPD
jgi:hypothetical protein